MKKTMLVLSTSLALAGPVLAGQSIQLVSKAPTCTLPCKVPMTVQITNTDDVAAPGVIHISVKAPAGVKVAWDKPQAMFAEPAARQVVTTRMGFSLSGRKPAGRADAQIIIRWLPFEGTGASHPLMLEVK